MLLQLSLEVVTHPDGQSLRPETFARRRLRNRSNGRG